MSYEPILVGVTDLNQAVKDALYAAAIVDTGSIGPDWEQVNAIGEELLAWLREERIRSISMPEDPEIDLPLEVRHLLETHNDISAQRAWAWVQAKKLYGNDLDTDEMLAEARKIVRYIIEG